MSLAMIDTSPADQDATAMLHMVDELSANARLNGAASALRDARGFWAGCLAFIQAQEGASAALRLLSDATRDCQRRAALEQQITRGRR